MAGRALVLSGGGTVGIAWETGVVAGLAEEGVRLADADLIIGTSAGSVVGAQLALGLAPEALVEEQRARFKDNTAIAARPEGAPPAPDTSALMALAAKMADPNLTEKDRLKELGRLALESNTPSEEAWVGSFERRFNGRSAWPEKEYRCTAIDANTGDFVVWDRDSGVDLFRAVASSCAVPGVYPPVTINGRRYYDGGLRSASNADLAKGSDVVVIISLAGGGAPPDDPRALLAWRRIENETRILKESGARTVELIPPDDAARASFGLNMLDWRKTADALEEGLRQGRAEAARLRDLWR